MMSGRSLLVYVDKFIYTPFVIKVRGMNGDVTWLEQYRVGGIANLS